MHQRVEIVVDGESRAKVGVLQVPLPGDEIRCSNERVFKVLNRVFREDHSTPIVVCQPVEAQEEKPEEAEKPQPEEKPTNKTPTKKSAPKKSDLTTEAKSE